MHDGYGQAAARSRFLSRAVGRVDGPESKTSSNDKPEADVADISVEDFELVREPNLLEGPPPDLTES